MPIYKHSIQFENARYSSGIIKYRRRVAKIGIYIPHNRYTLFNFRTQIQVARDFRGGLWLLARKLSGNRVSLNIFFSKNINHSFLIRTQYT